MTRQVIPIEMLPVDAREALMAYAGEPVRISLPHSCRWCHTTFEKNGMACTRAGYCSSACEKAAISADIAQREAKAKAAFT